MTTVPDYVPVAVAAELVGRDPSRIYRWVRTGEVPSRETSRGIEVLVVAVQRVAGTKRRGRPSRRDTPRLQR